MAMGVGHTTDMPTPIVASFITEQGSRLYYSHEDVFTAFTVEDACPFADEEAVEVFCELVGESSEIVIFEYLAAAIAREDQEYMAQLADLRG